VEDKGSVELVPAADGMPENEVSMGEDSGIDTSPSRPPCEPAPVVVVVVVVRLSALSRTLISTAAPALSVLDCGGWVCDEEFVIEGLLFVVV
jgi:hypothetical protein